MYKFRKEGFFKDFRMFLKVLKTSISRKESFRKFQKVSKNSERFLRIQKGFRKFQKVSESFKRFQKVIKVQECSNKFDNV
jgi:hypothetical protein